MDRAVDSVQIAFYLLIGTLTFFTYRRARLGLFLPLRTEVFKEQLVQLQTVLREFSGKAASHLNADLGLADLLDANCEQLYAEYAEYEFGVPADAGFSELVNACSYRAPSRDMIVQTRPPQASFNQGGQGPDLRWMIQDERGLRSADDWTEVKYHMVLIPPRFVAYKERIADLEGLALLPTDLQRLLGEFIELLNGIPDEVRRMIRAQAPTMVRHYPTAESLDDRHYYWIQSGYRSPPLSEKADEVVSYIRGLFDPDGLSSHLRE